MLKPKRPNIETPAARHYAHTKLEWQADPSAAPIWARGASGVIGASNSAGCEECEEYVESVFRPTMRDYEQRSGEYRIWKAEQDRLAAEMIRAAEGGENGPALSLDDLLSKLNQNGSPK